MILRVYAPDAPANCVECQERLRAMPDVDWGCVFPEGCPWAEIDMELLPMWEFCATSISKNPSSKKGEPDTYAVSGEGFEMALRNEGITDPFDRKRAMRIAHYAAEAATDSQLRSFVDDDGPELLGEVEVKPKKQQRKSLKDRLSPELAAKFLAKGEGDGT